MKKFEVRVQEVLTYHTTVNIEANEEDIEKVLDHIEQLDSVSDIVFLRGDTRLSKKGVKAEGFLADMIDYSNPIDTELEVLEYDELDEE